MGKKNKKENKGKGKEKTAQKTERKAQKRTKKELAEKGEEDIENLIAEFKKKDKQQTEVVEEKCEPPSPRCSMTMTAHPDKEELIMFGGEYFTGNSMFVYNDLFFYNIRKNEWMKVTSPGGPPPRSAHQAVALHQCGGQLWIFGGEFSSHSQLQFYHYKDLWVLHLKEKRWEKINAPGGPTSRSGHRMVAVKKQLIIFGGFHDNIRDYKYYNDVYAFNVESYTWTKLDVSGTPPLPRSGHVMAAMQDQPRVMVYGGYSKERLKKETDKGKTHTDMFILVPEGRTKDDPSPTKWRWQAVKQTGSCPSARCGLSLTVAPGNRAILFGGVHDENENEEELEGTFFNSLLLLELDKCRWHNISIRGKKEESERKKRRRKVKDEDGEAMAESVECDDEHVHSAEDNLQQLSLEVDTQDEPDSVDTTYDDGIFKVTVGPQGVSADGDGMSELDMDVEIFRPSPRMNTVLVVKNGVLFLYGGLYEEGDKQVTLADFYSLDLQKLEEWNVIIHEDKKLQVWVDSDSSGDDEEGEGEEMEGACGGEEESSSDSEEDMEITFDDAPPFTENESCADYFDRCKDYWTQQARTINEDEHLGISMEKLEKFAKEICASAFNSEKSTK
ncbi:kelch domain-containing protein 4-like [Gigantopelta aegis]|uniref:kelch domain-containing protein 4-like n=1 Tax=Gigantopelta aegis TaxID=1735272 RepID=UPI001B8873E3|nr:kelch domain-containing protein 4-like [Gigantopelta aegis]